MSISIAESIGELIGSIVNVAIAICVFKSIVECVVLKESKD